MRISGRVVSTSAVVLGFLLLSPLIMRAQMRMATAARVHPAFHPVRIVPSATHAMAVPRARINTVAPRRAQPAPTGIFFNQPGDIFGNQFLGGGSGETLQELLDPVPGPGFNYAHVAALDRDLAIKAVIDPETQWRLAVAEQVARATSGFGAGGYYLLDGGGEYVMPSQPAAEQPSQPSQPPEVIVLQEPAQKPSAQAAPAAAPQPQQPIPDVGNFTLVFKNGQKIQAMAFTRSGGRIVYITSDGRRHAIAASELDNAATERVNEDRGTQLTL
jgi:hypothetical protein